MSLVRILQDLSTTVCFRMLSRQVEGAVSRSTWKGRAEEPHKSGCLGRAPPQPAHTSYSQEMRLGLGDQGGEVATHRKLTSWATLTFLVSAHWGFTFQEFPKSTGFSSSCRLLLVKSLFWTPSKFPHRPHIRSCQARGEVERLRGQREEQGGLYFVLFCFFTIFLN